MPAIESRTRRGKIDVALATARLPTTVHIRLIANYHVRGDGKSKCACGCGNIYAKASRIEIIDEKIWDGASGDAIFKSANKPREFENAAALCDAHWDWNLTLSDIPNDHGLAPGEMVFDNEARQILCVAGVRSGKSEHGAMWLAVQIFKNGGLNSDGTPNVFWIIAPSRKRTHTMMRKFLKTLPDGMLISRPTKSTQNEQSIKLFDGTQIDLWHTARPEEWKGDDIRAAWWTETSSESDPATHTTLVTRTIDTNAPLWLEGTPESSAAWVELKLFEPARKGAEALRRRTALLAKTDLTPAEDQELRDLANFRQRIKVVQFGSKNNPFIPSANVEIAREMAAAGGMNEGEIARQFDGEFRSDREKLFDRYWSKIENVIELSSPNIGLQLSDAAIRLGGTDITREVSRGFFGKSHDWILGADINEALTNIVCCKVYGEVNDPGSYSLLVYEAIRMRNLSHYEKARELAKWNMGLYKGAGMAIDISATWNNNYAADSQGVPVSQRFIEKGFNVVGCFRDFQSRKSAPKEGPSIVTLKNMMERRDGKRRLIVNDTLGHPLVRAIEDAECARNGGVYSEPHSWGDANIKGPIDALRYISWATFYLGAGLSGKTVIINQ